MFASSGLGKMIIRGCVLWELDSVLVSAACQSWINYRSWEYFSYAAKMRDESQTNAECYHTASVKVLKDKSG